MKVTENIHMDNMNISGIFLAILVILLIQVLSIGTDKRCILPLLSMEKNISSNISQKLTIDQIKEIGKQWRHDQRFRILPPSLINRIRYLKINKKRKRGSRGRKRLHSNNVNNNNSGVNTKNLIEIQSSNGYISDLSLGLLNCQSLKNKDSLILSSILENNLDIVLLTETWIKNNTSDLDQTWLQCCELNSNNYKIENIPRKGEKRGGGIAIVIKNNLNKKLLLKLDKPEFEAAIWKINSENKLLHIMTIYRPPNASTITQFTDALCHTLENCLADYKNLLIVGDFNIHTNNWEDSEVLNFLDTTDALGLVQHVKFPTHKQGNTLDLVFSNCVTNQVKACTPADFISDHRLININMTIKKAKSNSIPTQGRKWKNFNPVSFFTDADLNNTVTDDNLTEYWNNFTETVNKTLDKQIPIQKIYKKTNHQADWFDLETKNHKKRLQHYEDIWRQNRTDTSWKKLQICSQKLSSIT